MIFVNAVLYVKAPTVPADPVRCALLAKDAFISIKKIIYVTNASYVKCVNIQQCIGTTMMRRGNVINVIVNGRNMNSKIC